MMKNPDNRKPEHRFAERFARDPDIRSEWLTSKENSMLRRMLIFGAVMLLFAVLVPLFPRDTLIKQNQQAEREEMQRSTNLLRYAVLAEISALDTIAADWATWDDTYKYMQERDPSFINSNIQWDALSEKSSIDLVYLRDSQGNYVWGGQSSDPLPAAVPRLKPELVKALDQIEKTSFKGVILAKNSEPLIVSAHPILPSSGEGASRGTLIMGRYLDNTVLNKWDGQTQLDIQLHYPGGQGFSSRERTILSRIGITPWLQENEDGARVYIAFNDLRGEKWLASIAWSGQPWDNAKKVADFAFWALFGAITSVTIILLIAFLAYMLEVNRTRRKLSDDLDKRTAELAASENRYRQMFDDMADAVFIYDKDFFVLHHNKQAYTRLGYTDEDLLENDQPEVIAREWKEHSRQQTLMIKEGNSRVYESYHVKKDGTLLPVEVSAQVIEFNEQPCYLAIVRDISQRKEAEAARAASERLYRAIFETVQAGIVLIDVEKRLIVDANPAALSMFVGTLGDIQGNRCHHLLCPAEEGACPVLDLHQEVDCSERLLLRQDGSRLPILKDVIRVTIGEKQYLLESFFDLTERKAMEEELRMAKDAAEAGYLAKTMFLANMSHEIRTPLNAILGYAQLMKRDAGLTDTQKDKLDIISSSGVHLLNIINDILEMAKIEAGHSNLNENVCDFNRLLDDIENMFHLPVEEKGLVLLVERLAIFAPNLMVDEGKVRQVLVNLIGNALKFTQKGGIVLRISQEITGDFLSSDLLLEPGAEIQTIIEVEDTGRGIPAHRKDMIFGVFEQAQNDGNKEGGTGLGLAISRNFADMLGGSLLLVRSQENEGSLFRFTFKASVAPEITKAPLVEERRVASIVHRRPWKVLVVDDRETNRNLLVQLLSGIGFQVKEAKNGLEGIEAFESWHPDLVLMDLMMPVMNGYEAISIIKASNAGKATPVIAISASVMDENELGAQQAGADAFIRKPFREQDLLQVIHQLAGVEYIYEGDPAYDESREAEEGLSTGGSLPEELLDAVLAAVEQGDMAEMGVCLEKIAEIDVSTAARMQKMADKYDYDQLINMIMTMGGKGGQQS